MHMPNFMKFVQCLFKIHVLKNQNVVDGQTHRWTDNVNSIQTQFAGGIIIL